MCGFDKVLTLHQQLHNLRVFVGGDGFAACEPVIEVGVVFLEKVFIGDELVVGKIRFQK
jgi:hypothetical protein